MTRALILAAVASGFTLALAVPAHAAPVDGTLPDNGFMATNARDAGATLDPLGDLAVDAASIARAWPGETYGIAGASAATSGPQSHGFTPSAGFESLLRDSDGRSLASGLDRNPYFALGTWGGDGRAIVHHVIAAASGMQGSGAGADYAVELAFDGFHVGDYEHATATDGPSPFDGAPMFIPNPIGFGNGTSTPGGGSGTGIASGDPGNSDPGRGGNGGNGGGNNGGDPGGPGTTAGGGPGGSSGGGNPLRPVPEPGGLALLGMAIPAVLLMNRRRALARVAVPAAIAAAALLFAPGSAKAQLHDWEQLCNGTGGATPQVIVEGCSAVINADGESLNDVAIAYNNRGNALRALDRFDAAKADYDNAIILAPSDPFPYRNRGVTYGLLGNYAAALADFDRAIVLAPKYASAYLGRAFALEQLGKPRAAAADFVMAAKLDPKLVAAVRLPQSAALPAAEPR